MEMTKAAYRALSVDRMRQLFSYNPETGIVANRITRGNARAGEQAGTLRADGYRRISVDGIHVRAHNLAWALHHGRWPVEILDHINLVKSDDRLVNLREATYSLNNHNRIFGQNKTGFPGVSKVQRHFEARIWENGKSRRLGSFQTPQAAHAAYSAEKSRILSSQ